MKSSRYDLFAAINKFDIPENLTKLSQISNIMSCVEATNTVVYLLQ